VAAQLKRDLDVNAELVVGDAGEFSVWIDDAKVIEKRSGKFPDPQDVVVAVRARKP
jgi:predicted Rdx family selenoprotein